MKRNPFLFLLAAILAVFFVVLPAQFALAADHGATIDLTPIVRDVVAIVLGVILPAVIAYAVNRWGAKSAILRDEGLRRALLGGVDTALSWAQMKSNNWIGTKGFDVAIKNDLLALGANYMLASYPKYLKKARIDKDKITRILERRFGEIDQARKANVAPPPADPSVGLSNAAPGLAAA